MNRRIFSAWRENGYEKIYNFATDITVSGYRQRRNSDPPPDDLSDEEEQSMDAETLINVLIQVMPDQAESIRLLVPAIMDFLALQGKTVDAE